MESTFHVKVFQRFRWMIFCQALWTSVYAISSMRCFGLQSTEHLQWGLDLSLRNISNDVLWTSVYTVSPMRCSELQSTEHLQWGALDLSLQSISNEVLWTSVYRMTLPIHEIRFYSFLGSVLHGANPVFQSSIRLLISFRSNNESKSGTLPSAGSPVGKTQFSGNLSEIKIISSLNRFRLCTYPCQYITIPAPYLIRLFHERIKGISNILLLMFVVGVVRAGRTVKW